MENLEMIGKLFGLVEGLSKPVEQHEVKIANLQSMLAGLSYFVLSNASVDSLKKALEDLSGNVETHAFAVVVKAELARREAA